MRRAGLVAVAALLLAAPAWGATITRHATTATFRLTLAVGPAETMYTPAEVKAKHPKTGEVMVGGSTSMGSMPMGGVNHHLEVRIVRRATGRVVTNAKPSISLTDTTPMGGMGATQKVDAMAMQGIGEGISDLHYGDNVELSAGHSYKVAVTVNGEKASFTFRV